MPYTVNYLFSFVLLLFLIFVNNVLFNIPNAAFFFNTFLLPWKKKLIRKKNLKKKIQSSIKSNRLNFNTLHVQFLSNSYYYLTRMCLQNRNEILKKSFSVTNNYCFLHNFFFFLNTGSWFKTAQLFFLFTLLRNYEYTVSLAMPVKKKTKEFIDFDWNIRFVLPGQTILINSYFL
jgi:hypothetical protein